MRHLGPLAEPRFKGALKGTKIPVPFSAAEDIRMAEEHRPKRITDSYLAGLKSKAARYKKNLGNCLTLFISPKGKKVFCMIWDIGRKSYT